MHKQLLESSGANSYVHASGTAFLDAQNVMSQARRCVRAWQYMSPDTCPNICPPAADIDVGPEADH